MDDVSIRTIVKKKDVYLRKVDVERFILKASTCGKTERETKLMLELAEKLGRLS